MSSEKSFKFIFNFLKIKISVASRSMKVKTALITAVPNVILSGKYITDVSLVGRKSWVF